MEAENIQQILQKVYPSSSESLFLSLVMGSSEKLCLQWNDFKENITFSFKALRDDKEFTDVTLACEDDQQIEVHKTVLATSSPFFMDLLKRHKHSHPLIYMRGIKSNLLVTILDFLYHGEANVLQYDLDSFLALAEEFQLRGLTGNSPSDTEQQKEVQKNNHYSLKREFGQQYVHQNEQPIPNPNHEIQYSDGKNDKTVALANSRTSVELQDLDEQIRSMITKSDISAGPGKGLLATCNVCGTQRPYMQMPGHVEANHITGVSHSCDICGKTSRSRKALWVHKANYHKNKTSLQD